MQALKRCKQGLKVAWNTYWITSNITPRQIGLNHKVKIDKAQNMYIHICCLFRRLQLYSGFPTLSDKQAMISLHRMADERFFKD